jgi:16S rRNA (guanine527-N7)-methyltransferase
MHDKLTIPSQVLSDQAAKLGASLSKEQISQIGQFSSLLAGFNEHTNLVANCEEEVLLRDHILDSLSLVSSIKEAAPKENLAGGLGSLIDIGSGGGFPGLILAIAEPALSVSLVESVGKKARFLSEAITSLSLNDRVSVFNSRAELMAHDKSYRQRFDFATCRALGALSTVLELTLPFLRRGGLALIQRSAAQAKNESEPAGKAVGKLRAKLSKIILLDEEVLAKERAVLLFEQKAAVPNTYPRPWPKPKQAPLF